MLVDIQFCHTPSLVEAEEGREKGGMGEGREEWEGGTAMVIEVMYM